MKYVKVRFELEILEDGFPPVGVETLNGQLIDNDLVKLDNTPFFATGVAVGDLLNCSKTKIESIYQFETLVSSSGYKSISIIFVDDSCKESIYQHLKACGCYCEYGEFDGFNMLAVSAGKDLDYNGILSYLNEYEDSGRISYAELCV
ncbi:MAG: DUF4265 domain-containing protein [Pyrinomonadaceae bacterium]